MESPESGIDSGRWPRNRFNDRVMRRCGTFASTSACAVRSTMRSWNVKRHVLRAPRAGETKPAFTSARSVLFER